MIVLIQLAVVAVSVVGASVVQVSASRRARRARSQVDDKNGGTES